MDEKRIRRKAEHLCVQCGCQDERTLKGMVRCAKCSEACKRNMKNRNQYLKEHQRCIRCGERDAFTIAGRCYCAECAEKTRASSREWDRLNREHRRELYAETVERMKAAGICTRCHKRPAKPGRLECAVCLKKNMLRQRQKHEKPMSRMEGHCFWCGKPLDGAVRTCGIPSKLCQSCQAKAEAAEEKRKKKKAENANHSWRKDETMRCRKRG